MGDSFRYDAVLKDKDINQSYIIGTFFIFKNTGIIFRWYEKLLGKKEPYILRLPCKVILYESSLCELTRTVADKDFHILNIVTLSDVKFRMKLGSFYFYSCFLMSYVYCERGQK